MTNQEIMDLVGNMFYQMFLVEVDSFNFGLSSGASGTRVKFIIEGDAFRDETTLTEQEKADMAEEMDQDLE